ncbi:MAG TPA: endolytic transglycosylase MltG [Candidatus Paceibacterota bacterium]|nr:endolytic transglycosylase MltG [Candidatus Paceibacterota bacterium]
MDPIQRFLERFFAWSDNLQKRLSKEWREHTNRRTLAITVVVGACIAVLYLAVIQPPKNFPTGQLVTVPEGASLDAIARTLYEDGVVRSPLVFKALVTLFGRERGIYAGDYEFKQPETVFSIARALSVGAYGLVPIRIRIPEGATMRQMAPVFEAELPRFNASNFLAQTGTMEGYLFPDTYFFLPNSTEGTVIEAMRQDFNTQVAPLLPQIASSTHSLSDIVTMASMLEKEAANTQDRRTIAGILWHRLALGLPLQVDSTLIYENGKADSALTITDLKADTPYNTYAHKGLPPTPIGNPSLDSLQDALDPITTQYLYYLADKHGVTHYCKTYACQLQNQRIYLGT